jgi:hypothetical protein
MDGPWSIFAKKIFNNLNSPYRAMKLPYFISLITNAQNNEHILENLAIINGLSHLQYNDKMKY